jgi:hypothetical protein
VPKNDAGVPKNSAGVPKNSAGAPKNSAGVPKKDIYIQKNQVKLIMRTHILLIYNASYLYFLQYARCDQLAQAIPLMLL